ANDNLKELLHRCGNLIPPRVRFPSADKDPALATREKIQRSQSALSEVYCFGTSRRITGPSNGKSALRTPRGRKSNSLLSSVPSPDGVSVYLIVRSGFPRASTTSRRGRS